MRQPHHSAYVTLNHSPPWGWAWGRSCQLRPPGGAAADNIAAQAGQGPLL